MNSLTLCCATLLVVAACFTETTLGYGFRHSVLVECEQPDSYIVHEDCTKYYQCDNGEPLLQECRDGLFFNPETVSCDYPENVPECIGGTREPGYEVTRPTNPTSPAPEVTTPTPELTTESSGEITCPAEGVEYFPDPTNCQNYFLCAEGVVIPQTCADGLLFDPETKKCRIADEVNCGVATNPTTVKPDPEITTGNPDPQPTTDGPLPTDCPASGEIYLPVDGDCTSYIWCVEGTDYPMECGTGTEFSPEEQACVLESEYECPFSRAIARKVFRGVLSHRH